MNELDHARRKMHELEDSMREHPKDDVSYAEAAREFLRLEAVPLEHVEHVLSAEARRVTRLSIQQAGMVGKPPSMLAAASVGIVQGITLAEALRRVREGDAPQPAPETQDPESGTQEGGAP